MGLILFTLGALVVAAALGYSGRPNTEREIELADPTYARTDVPEDRC